MNERLAQLEAQLTGPKRVALFGNRAIGKTTLLAMFYREASAGRVPLVRLAAGDAKTAEYLGDRIAQLEAGEPVAATLAETPLRLKLYHGMTRLDLIVKDYQGEHVALGAEAPIHDFFADCDAVFLCLDAAASDQPTDRRRRQQEIELLLERYIEQGDARAAGRPLAVLLTKYDRVIERGGPTAAEADRLLESSFGMTRHALAEHAPGAAVFAVSSYGMGVDASNRPPATLAPMGLDAPLGWLSERLEAVDRERLEWLFDLAPTELPLLARCLKAFERRYPRSAAAIDLKRRLGRLRRRRTGRRIARTALVAAALLLGVIGYDACGYHDALRYEQTGNSAPDVEARWDALLQRHPTLPWFFPANSSTARRKHAEWQVKSATVQLAGGKAQPNVDQIRELKARDPALIPSVDAFEAAESAAREKAAWKALRVADVVGIEDPVAHLASARKFLREFPETTHRAAAVTLVRELETAVSMDAARSDSKLLENVRRASGLPNASHADLIAQLQTFLNARNDSPHRGEAEELLASLVESSDASDIALARQFSRDNPTRFDARRARYRDYLNTHSSGGRHISEANAALDQIDREEDRHLYRSAYDHWVAHPDDVPAIAERLSAYITASPDGAFATAARSYLEWWTRISSPSGYRVTLKRGRVEPNVGKAFAGAGPDLGVTLWVAGIEYGPSPVIKDTRAPIWDHTFDTEIRWKYGDPISIRIVDHDWGPSGVFTLTSPAGDKLAMRLLSTTVRPSKGGRTELVFASDFNEPRLPRPE